MADVFENDGSQAWAALHAAVGAAVGQETNGVEIQPLAVAERADWDTSHGPLNAYRELRIANQVPTWNPLYQPNSGVTVPDEYQAFLDSLNSTLVRGSGVADAERLRRLDEERRSAQNQLQNNEVFVNAQWDRYARNSGGNPPLPRPEWETMFGYAAIRLNLQRRVQAALAAYMVTANDAGGDLLEVGRALSAMADPRQRVALPVDEEDLKLPPASWQHWYRASLSDDLQSFLTTEVSARIDISNTSTRSERFEDRWSGRASMSWFGLFGAGGGASNQTIRAQTESQTDSVRISFENLQTFPVRRGQWFKAGLISRFRDRMPEGFWSEAGRLNLIPASVVLARGVGIDVSTSREVTDYFFNKRSAGGGGGFRIGPFKFGGRGRRTTTHVESALDRTATGFRLSDTSGRAQVVAVVSIRPNDLLAQGPTQPLGDRIDVGLRARGFELVAAARRGTDSGVLPFEL